MYLPDNTELQNGRYRIVRHISSGGFGNTYEGVHVMLDNRVAIKEFYVKDFCNRDETSHSVTVGITAKTALVGKLRKKFVDEAKGLSRLHHPNIVHVLDVFEENGTAYYVMDYIDGPSLGDMVKREGKIDEARALKYIRQICDALEYVHAHNRLHLDIKPGNIMVDEHDNAFLIDFGASKQYDEEAGENTSTLLGKTPGYAPLEQMGNDVVTFIPATDIYALGATLYKILTGKTPPSAAALASGESLPPLPASVSTHVSAAIRSAMEVNKTKRPQTIKEFRALLDKKNYDDETTIIEVEKAPKPKVEPVKAKQDPAKSKEGKIFGLEKKWLYTAVAIAILVVSVAIGLIFGGKSDSASDMQDSTAVVGEVTIVSNQTFTDSNGEKFTYSGEVVNGKPNGKGEGKYSFGQYTGEYKDGLMHGNGVFKESGGAIVKGRFENDGYAEGTLIRTDGTYFVGKFKNGEPSNGDWIKVDDNIKKLYDTLVKEGYDMEPESEFRKNIADPKKRKAVYDALSEGYDLETYQKFEQHIGFALD